MNTNPLRGLLLTALLFGLAGCFPAANDDELSQMCENLIRVRAEIRVPVESELIAEIEADYTAAKSTSSIGRRARRSAGTTSWTPASRRSPPRARPPKKPPPPQMAKRPRPRAQLLRPSTPKRNKSVPSNSTATSRRWHRPRTWP